MTGWLALGLALAGQGGWSVSACRAGGGPENVFLVVNARSWASLAVANHWVRLRGIPHNQVLYLDYPGLPETIGVEAFRQQILVPVLASIDRQGLAGQIDYVVYSSDFPYAVDCQADAGERELPNIANPTASLTSLTYLYLLALKKDVNYLGLNSNFYFRRPRPGSAELPSQGFRGWYGWNGDGSLLETGGMRYFLSTMLAATSGRGNSLGEAVNYLTRSARADGQRPAGAFVFTETGDVRSTTRTPAFEAAVRALRLAGLKGEIVSEPTPSGRPNVLGVTMGTPSFDWGRSQSQFAPGAIADNLTSTGGVLKHAGSQTPLSEFLRYGAAGASGTVVEPYAIAEKFPSPFLHVHYARGATLAEAFYQAVAGPGQLLVVGDPLCRPWAQAPQVELDALAPGAVVQGTLTLAPRVAAGGPPVDRWELFVDGNRVARVGSDEPLRWDSSTAADGHHELSLVAIDAGEIETQGRLRVPVVIDNRGLKCEASRSGAGPVAWGTPLVLSANSPGAEQILFFHGSRAVAQFAGPQGQVQLNPATLGLGPVTLRPVARQAGQLPTLVYGPPLEFEVTPPPALPGEKLNLGRLPRGLWLEPAEGPGVPIQQVAKFSWLESAGVKPNQPYVLKSVFEQPKDEVVQFQLRFVGELELAIDGQPVFRGSAKKNSELTWVPVHLGRGGHRLRIDGRPKGAPRLDIRYGGEGTRQVDGREFRHAE